MNPIKAVVFFALALLCVASSLAHAGTVTFNVPLDVKSYPETNGNVEVWCELRSAQDQPIEAGMVVVQVHNGSLSGFTQVKVEYLPQEAAILRKYRCALVAGTKTGLGSDTGKAFAKSIPLGATILRAVGGTLQ